MSTKHSSYHVVLVNPKNGEAELWKDFVPSEQVREVEAEAKSAYPNCLCIVRNAAQYPDPMILIDECIIN